MLLSTVDINQENIKEWTVLDSGAIHCFPVVDGTVNNVTSANNPITVTTLDGTTLQSTHIRVRSNRSVIQSRRLLVRRLLGDNN